MNQCNSPYYQNKGEKSHGHLNRFRKGTDRIQNQYMTLKGRKRNSQKTRNNKELPKTNKGHLWKTYN